ncbi:4Fe-4S binding protein [Elusimicrobiota bacterium]
MIITSIAERILLPGILLAFLLLFLTFIFGRFFCGWICPLGATMDFWTWINSKFIKKRENEPGKLVNVKYILLFVIFSLSFFGIQFVWLFDPITIFVRTFSFTIHPFIVKIIERFFITLLDMTNYSSGVEVFYYKVKENVLNLSNPVFPHTYTVFIIFIVLLLVIFIKRRFWCRYLCPLGAMFAITARFTPFKRHTYCTINCGSCKNICRMNAIKSDNSYLPQECILCLDCIEYCMQGSAKFSFFNTLPLKESDKTITRTEFLKWAGGTIAFISLGNKANSGLNQNSLVIRPPGALVEKDFIRRCIRCGNCMKVCLTNVLQPAVIESGTSGIWTPKMNFNIGYCEYKCNLCTQVCPTGAIEMLNVEEKMRFIIGLAQIDKKICLPWATGEHCIVCEEHCPISDKAIKLTEERLANGKILKKPYVCAELCNGCGICENKCPVTPEKAIKVMSISSGFTRQGIKLRKRNRNRGKS